MELDRARAKLMGVLSEETRKELVRVLELEKQPVGNGFGALKLRDEIFHRCGTSNDLLCCFLKKKKTLYWSKHGQTLKELKDLGFSLSHLSEDDFNEFCS